MTDLSIRPEFFTCHNGEKMRLPFSEGEYARRLSTLRSVMAARDIPVVLLTSMQNIAYYSGFLYCSFGRPYGCVVTADACTTVSANIDAGQPWRRSVGENVIYTDWQRHNFWRAVASLSGQPGRVGIEADHMTLATRDIATDFLGNAELVDIAPDAMAGRMVKSQEEI
ncbi:MAG: creatininase, partial [Silicimonas sp.]|nr:creatininase [Silicimonas sp.]